MSTNDHNRRLCAEMAKLEYPVSTLALAREGHWSDFGSPLPFPKLALVEMLRQDGHDELARRVEAGEFDG